MPSDIIPLCEPFFGGKEREYVDECVRSGWVSSVGQFVNRFEAMFADYVQAPEAVAVSTGTAALHLSLLAVGVQPGDEVLVSSMTFIAPANAIRYVGAHPVFIDAEPDYWQMDMSAVQSFLETQTKRAEDGALVNRATGRRISALLPVHILGHPVDMDRLMVITNAYNLKVVEDATESLGGFWRGRALGTIGHAGCFSFNGNKLMTTGGGGMVVAGSSRAEFRREDDLNKKITRHVRHLSTQAKLPGGEYIHNEVGYNYRLTNLQAALGCAQLEQLDSFLQRKKEIAAAYQAAFGSAEEQGNSGIRIKFMREADYVRSAWWLCTVLVDDSGRDASQEPKRDRGSRELIAHLAANGVIARPLWQPMHLSPAHETCHVPGQPACPVAERLYEQGVSLPSSVGITDAQLQRVIALVKEFAA